MPPPPPPAPPPLPKLTTGASNNQLKSNEPPADRNALLSQIRKGARLKKAETNDRSSPLVDAKGSSSTAAKRSNDTKANGPFPVIPPGGLFAQGIPKLRPTTPRSDNSSSSPLSMVIQSIKQQGNSSSSLRVTQLTGSRSQPPSPVSKPRTAGAVSNRIVNYQNSENSCTSLGNPSFPDDVNIKGPAPAPPPQSQKPVFRSNAESDSSIKHSTVKRSASQTSLQRPRLTRPPPSEKPPPPPKSNPNPPSNAPPPPPSKPPNIMRRQSFGIGESHNSRFVSSKLSVANSIPKPNAKVIGPPPPPPPPRNNSAPNDLNQMVQSSSPGNHLVKMNIAPPPPPNRAPASNVRSAPVRPPPPRAPAPPPPPPQHQFPMHPAPPSQLKAAVPVSNLAPPPPARVSSIKQSGSDFEEQFRSMFCSAQSLPKPEKFTHFQKVYPSRMVRQKQSIRRQPPPPPPLAGVNDRSRNNPVIPVQYDSGIFSGNYNHS